MKRKLLVPIFVTLSFTACSNMSDTQQRALSGGAIGAAAGTAGALIFNGNPIWGAIGGAAVGTAAGLVYDNSQKQKQPQSKKTTKNPSSGGTSPTNQ
jgi:osmotically inducible lipoprotein OsmB